MNPQKTILEKISEPGMIDYAYFKDEVVMKKIPAVLDELLKNAEEAFDELLKMPDEEVNFESFMDRFFHSDEALSNLYSAVESYNSTNSSELTRKIITDFQPKLVDYQNKISLSKPLYEKLKLIEDQELTQEQARSLHLVIQELEVAGVHVSDEKRKRLEEINKRMSELSDQFNNNTIDSKAEFFYEINDEADVEGIPEADKEMAKMEAGQRKSEAAYVFTLSPPSYLAIMRYCPNATIREAFHRANATVATSGKKDNRPLVLELLQLREEKAKLLGFKRYTQYVLQERMANTPEAVLDMLEKISEKALPEAQKNIEELKAFSKKEAFENWDLTYYFEKLKKEKYDVDDKDLKPYFSWENVLNGLFGMAQTLFGLEMKPMDIPPYAEGSKAYEVFHRGEHVAYYFIDPHARPEKRPGAWANDLRSGYVNASGTKRLPIVINECNFPKPTADSPALLSHRDVETIFHEFGHAIHVMLSSATLANLNGFGTEWDFVEAPSQILENWCWEYDVLKTFAKHHETGEVIPKALIERLKESKNFMSALFLVRQNEFGYLDYLLHNEPAPQTVEELDEKCEAIVNKYSPIKKFDGYKMYASFGHIFAGGYSAGYYSYAWAETMEASMYEKAKEMGILSKAFGDAYVKKILAMGTKKPAMELFIDFTGKKPSIEALFKKHGI